MPELLALLLQGLWESLYMTLVSTLLAYVLGLPLGLVLVVTDRDGICPVPWLNTVLGVVVNMLRSVPFLILMVMVFPLSRLIVGTSIGTVATIVPLTVAAAPFVARLVEGSLREADQGIIEAAQAMGCTTFQIVWKVLLPEALPSLIAGFINAAVTILSYGAMAGSIGGGGLGAMALKRGWTRNQLVVLYGAVIVLVLLVQIFQTLGSRAARRVDKRLR